MAGRSRKVTSVCQWSLSVGLAAWLSRMNTSGAASRPDTADGCAVRRSGRQNRAAARWKVLVLEEQHLVGQQGGADVIDHRIGVILAQVDAADHRADGRIERVDGQGVGAGHDAAFPSGGVLTAGAATVTTASPQEESSCAAPPSSPRSAPPVGKFLGRLASMTAGELGAVILQGAGASAPGSTRRHRRRDLRPGLRQRRGALHRPLVGPGGRLADRASPATSSTAAAARGLQAVIDAAMMVQTGAADVVVAGGVESMSNAEYYTTDMRSGARAGSVTLHDRLARGRVMSQPIEPLRRHLRHDRDRRQPGPRLPDQPRGLPTNTRP